MTDMPLISNDDLLRERHRYFIAARGGISLPVAGAVYWFILGWLGTWMEVRDWALWAAMLSGMIFPLGLLLQRPLKSNFMKAKSPVGGSAIMAIMGINFLWPVHFVVMAIQPEAVVLSLAIAMTVHWPIIGWSYASKACMAHAIARMALVVVMFFAFPEYNLTGLPVAIGVLYLMAAAGIAFEVSLTRRRLAGATA